MICTGYGGVLVLNFLVMGDTVFFSPKVDGKMIFTWLFPAFYDIPGPGKNCNYGRRLQSISTSKKLETPCRPWDKWLIFKNIGHFMDQKRYISKERKFNVDSEKFM